MTIPERSPGQMTEPPNRTSDFFQGFQFNTEGATVFHFGAFGIFRIFLPLALNSKGMPNDQVIPNDDISGFLARMFMMIGILLLFVIVLY